MQRRHGSSQASAWLAHQIDLCRRIRPVAYLPVSPALQSVSTLTKRIGRLLPDSLRVAIRNQRFRLRNRGFEPYVGEQEHFGEHFRFYVGDRVSESWFKSGWDWTEIEFLKDNVVEKGDVILEAGAHHGELMLFLSRWVGPEGHITTFDPVPLNTDVIATNLKLNGVENVTLVRAAVGSEAGRTWITEESNAQISGPGQGIEVDVVTLDDYAHLKPTLLKIDVEGFEAAVLKGAQTILETRPKLHIELHPNPLKRFGSSLKEVLQLLGSEQYNLWYRLKGEDNVRPYNGEPIESEAHLFALPKESA